MSLLSEIRESPTLRRCKIERYHYITGLRVRTPRAERTIVEEGRERHQKHIDRIFVAVAESRFPGDTSR